MSSPILRVALRCLFSGHPVPYCGTRLSVPIQHSHELKTSPGMVRSIFLAKATESGRMAASRNTPRGRLVGSPYFWRSAGPDTALWEAWISPVKSLYTVQSVGVVTTDPQIAVFLFRSTMNSPGG